MKIVRLQAENIKKIKAIDITPKGNTRLEIPLRRKKPTVYAVWDDLFHEGVSFDFRCSAYLEMTNLPRHTFLILTKRPKNMKFFVSAWEMSDFPRIWHGLTVCNQQEADEKIPIFLEVPGKKFLSIEPMLEKLDLTNYIYTRFEMGGARDMHNKLNAVILGGETGPGARPMNPDWVRSVRDQCEAAGVPFFFKGWGRWTTQAK